MLFNQIPQTPPVGGPLTPGAPLPTGLPPVGMATPLGAMGGMPTQPMGGGQNGMAGLLQMLQMLRNKNGGPMSGGISSVPPPSMNVAQANSQGGISPQDTDKLLATITQMLSNQQAQSMGPPPVPPGQPPGPPMGQGGMPPRPPMPMGMPPQMSPGGMMPQNGLPPNIPPQLMQMLQQRMNVRPPGM